VNITINGITGERQEFPKINDPQQTANSRVSENTKKDNYFIPHYIKNTENQRQRENLGGSQKGKVIFRVTKMRFTENFSLETV
jgi:hypothetical protein